MKEKSYRRIQLDKDFLNLCESDALQLKKELRKVSSVAELLGIERKPNILKVYVIDENGNKELIAETNNTITYYYRAVLFSNALFGTPVNKDNFRAAKLYREDFLTLASIPNNADKVSIELSQGQTLELNYGQHFGLRYVAIGCGGISQFSNNLLTDRPSAGFNNSTDPISNAKLYVPLHFGTPNRNSPNEYERYITPVNPITQEQYMLVDYIEPIIESNYPLPLGAKIQFVIPQYLANYEQQDWNRPDLQAFANDKGIVFINEFGFYFADIRTILDDAENVFMFAHTVYPVSFPKTPDIGYVFEYTFYF